MNYYNEFDPAAAQWIRNLISAGLIPPGDVDERSIEDVTPNELLGYTQCHFFAGIAGWSYALALAGRSSSESLWTGSCPCQPFSSAGKGAGFDDQRHLWPAFFHLIRECRPERIFGEQVASAIGHGWLDLVSADLEAEGYAVGATVLGAHSVGAPHIRQRLYFVADANDKHVQPASAYAARIGNSTRAGSIGELADANRWERDWFAVMRGAERDREDGRRQKGGSQPESCGEAGEFGHAFNAGPQGHGRSIHVDDAQGWQGTQRHGAATGFWDGGEWRTGADGKTRLIKPGLECLASGIPARMVRLRAYGNSICPQTAAAFIRTHCESAGEIEMERAA